MDHLHVSAQSPTCYLSNCLIQPVRDPSMTCNDDMMYRDAVIKLPIGSLGTVLVIMGHWQIIFGDFVVDYSAPCGTRESGRPRG